ncbi:TPR repeat family protein [Orientia tsutsugamushi str. Gilliam]|uniref:TPR repeat family protein n=1 Tax=Orientia tsutsugamushi str. Gilliam TaxID=1359184 RepID=A0A0F3M7R7_ORITS|nr:tetratricopeptide repeat protein [Orientia tsutsugamushi]KJV51813.1 TPR repeat family protein [Orientia tsutsugamushi str. Gilliam]
MAKAYYAKGLSLYELGQYQEAIKNFDIAIKYKPDFAEAYVNKGMALKALAQHQKAIEIFDTAIRYEPIWQKLIILKDFLYTN